MTRKVQRVLIVGRDAAAWLAALSIRRSVGAAGVTVEVVELPSLLQSPDAYFAVPSLRALHRLLGIEEALLLQACAGLPMVAQRFANWGRSKPPFLHGYETPPPGDDLSFIHYWTKAKQEGLRVEFEDFTLAASIAKQGRVPTDGSRAVPGYHLDARAYVDLLKNLALRSGIARRPGAAISLERDGERVSAVKLSDGSRLEGDLFIDASGAEASFISQLGSNDWYSWKHWLPCDRMLTASAPRLDPPPVFSQIAAFRAGWVGLHPLQDRTAVTAAWDSAVMSDSEIVQNLPVLSDMNVGGDAVISPLAPGLRARPWVGNCVAVGEAAVALELLDAVQLHTIHMTVSNLITLFPVDADRMPEADLYNGAIRAHAENIRDFQAAHYKLNQRYDEPMWDRVREADAPGSLQRKIDLFAARGEVPIYDAESFQEPNWVSIFIGHGLTPASYDPRVDTVPRHVHMAKVQDRLRDIAAEVHSMPDVRTFVSHASAGG